MIDGLNELKDRIAELETERDMYKERYETLCGRLRKKANDDRNINSKEEKFPTTCDHNHYAIYRYKTRDFWD